MSSEWAAFPPDIPTNVPTPARVYDYGLGGKDNLAVDREFALSVLKMFPENLDVARENRLFLYRVVRYLAREAGIRQFLDMGSGLPTQNNVHEVAQRFHSDARVVYVDSDPIVLAHGRALLADESSTTVITADMTDPRQVLEHADVHRFIDFSEPVAVLFLSVLHFYADEDTPRGILGAVRDAVVPGSYLAVSHSCMDDAAAAAQHTEYVGSLGISGKTRTPAEIKALVDGWVEVPPGLGDVHAWLPDPDQPPLSDVDAPLRPYLGASATQKRVKEYGGVLRKA